MPSALATMDRMNLAPYFGWGAGALIADSAAGFAASTALGTLYGKYQNKWYGQWMPAFFAAGGKLAALGLFLATGGKVRFPAVLLNSVGQAGINALGLNLGVKMGLKWAGKKLVVTGYDLGEGTSVAGELPPADPGRSLEELAVEDLANLR